MEHIYKHFLNQGRLYETVPNELQENRDILFENVQSSAVLAFNDYLTKLYWLIYKEQKAVN